MNWLPFFSGFGTSLLMPSNKQLDVVEQWLAKQKSISSITEAVEQDEVTKISALGAAQLKTVPWPGEPLTADKVSALGRTIMEAYQAKLFNVNATRSMLIHLFQKGGLDLSNQHIDYILQIASDPDQDMTQALAENL